MGEVLVGEQQQDQVIMLLIRHRHLMVTLMVAVLVVIIKEIIQGNLFEQYSALQEYGIIMGKTMGFGQTTMEKNTLLVL